MYIGAGVDPKTGQDKGPDGDYTDHLQRYGHPSKVGYKDIIPLWKAEKWDPEKLMALYKKAGAKYFVSMGSHHDNFFLWDSKIHRWNAVQMGPHKDVVGLWQKAAQAQGLRFGVSEHLGASFTWFQTSHGVGQDRAAGGRALRRQRSAEPGPLSSQSRAGRHGLADQESGLAPRMVQRREGADRPLSSRPPLFRQRTALRRRGPQHVGALLQRQRRAPRRHRSRRYTTASRTPKANGCRTSSAG